MHFCWLGPTGVCFETKSHSCGVCIRPSAFGGPLRPLMQRLGPAPPGRGYAYHNNKYFTKLCTWIAVFCVGQYCLPLSELLNPRRQRLREESHTVGSYGRSRGCSDSRCPGAPLPQPSPSRQARALCCEGSCVTTGTKAPVAQGGDACLEL